MMYKNIYTVYNYVLTHKNINNLICHLSLNIDSPLCPYLSLADADLTTHSLLPSKHREMEMSLATYSKCFFFFTHDKTKRKISSYGVIYS